MSHMPNEHDLRYTEFPRNSPTMWFLWLYLSAIFDILHGAISDIECGQNTTGISPKGEIVPFRLINNQHQEVHLVDIRIDIRFED